MTPQQAIRFTPTWLRARGQTLACHPSYWAPGVCSARSSKKTLAVRTRSPVVTTSDCSAVTHTSLSLRSALISIVQPALTAAAATALAAAMFWQGRKCTQCLGLSSGPRKAICRRISSSSGSPVAYSAGSSTSEEPRFIRSSRHRLRLNSPTVTSAPNACGIGHLRARAGRPSARCRAGWCQLAGHLDGDDCRAAWRAAHGEHSVERGQPALEPGQPAAVLGVGTAAAVVDDRDPQRAGLVG